MAGKVRKRDIPCLEQPTAPAPSGRFQGHSVHRNQGVDRVACAVCLAEARARSTRSPARRLARLRTGGSVANLDRMMRGLVLLRPAGLDLAPDPSRRLLVGGAARLGARRRRGSTSSSTADGGARRVGSARARCGRSSTCWTGCVVVDNGVEVVVPPLHHQVVTATLHASRSRRASCEAQRGARARSRGSTSATAHAGRPGRDRGLGAPVLSRATSRLRQNAISGRPSGIGGERASPSRPRGRDPLSERPRRRRLEDERRRRAPAERLARAHCRGRPRIFDELDGMFG